MRLLTDLAPPTRQHGWAGLVVILVALVIVAFLAKDALKKYGLVPPPNVNVKAGTPGERARMPGAIGAEALDLGASSVAPAPALERARSVEGMMKQQADERAVRGDGTAP